MPEPLRIAVVIPYYQEQRGVLARGLASIFAQVVAPSVRIELFVVDDASPVDPAGDIADAGAPPAHITVSILRRPNGGPGAARNTGLDAATTDHDVVAFLDSDDVWRSDHLARAQIGLETGADLYFCDFTSPDHRDGYFQSTKFYADLTRGDEAGNTAVCHGADIWSCEGARLAEWTIREYLAQTSTIVYRVARLGHVRFSEHLRFAGEDHLFFLDLAVGAKRASLSLAREVERGSGINVYDSARTWGDPRDLRRRIYNLGALRLMSTRASWSGATRRLLDNRLAQSRRVVSFLLMRQMFSSRSVPVAALRMAWSCDRRTALLFPFGAAAFLATKLVGKAGLNESEVER
jgi:succinoglycan biosynthesis protein ExoW